MDLEKALFKYTKTNKIYLAKYIGYADDLAQYNRWNSSGWNQNDKSSKSNGHWGYWIDGIGRVEHGKDGWEDTFAAFDAMGEQILVGDIIFYAMRNLTVSKMQVTKVEKGKIYGIDVFTKRKTRNGSPRKCLTTKTGLIVPIA